MSMTVKRRISLSNGNKTSEILQPIALPYFTDGLGYAGKK
jgi:hypothetical protein